ncbi:DUF6575 domain-containing protein [Desulfonema magnum]|uniref:Uncharacterized protein n=1 Tax=Desulfonema magnum TaxID=45655 RepID=A0A975GT95_9BACT|nr:DUF6575 domain-containing protein [Desulfonema magnum]QTA91903.1 Uncharacterized protein dnm_079760 [Desulfonema magnum]
MIEAKYKIQINLFEDTEVIEILDFEELPILYVETDTSASLYLSYLDKFIDEDIEQRLVIKISEDRLRKIREGLLSVRSAFESPETKFIFMIHLNQKNGKVENIYLLPNEVFQKYNTIDENYYLSYEEDEDDECGQDENINIPGFFSDVDIESLFDSNKKNYPTIKAPYYYGVGGVSNYGGV